MRTVLRAERIKRHWTQKYVSEQVGITKGALHNIETGQRKPSYDVLVKLMNLFECNDPRQLFEAAPDSNQC